MAAETDDLASHLEASSVLSSFPFTFYTSDLSHIRKRMHSPTPFVVCVYSFRM